MGEGNGGKPESVDNGFFIRLVEKVKDNRGIAVLAVLAVVFATLGLAIQLEPDKRIQLSFPEFETALGEGRVVSVTRNLTDYTVSGEMLPAVDAPLADKFEYVAPAPSASYGKIAEKVTSPDSGIVYKETLVSNSSLKSPASFCFVLASFMLILLLLKVTGDKEKLDGNGGIPTAVPRRSRMRDPSARFGATARVGGRPSSKASEKKSRGASGEGAAASVPVQEIRFSDIAGVDEALAEVMEVEEFLSHPDKFRKMGAKTPHGIMLAGEPGCGKTLMAKALAFESGASFFSVSGSEFMELYVGVGASRVRDLFREARENAPSILFIDEIDAVGRRRSTAGGESNGERDQTLNQILTEMDGFSSTDDVIVVAATNRIDTLDEALLRPGRFDRHIVVDKPDKAGRIEILKVHSRGKPVSEDVDYGHYGTITAGMSGADLANLMNEAAIFAARRDADEIGPTDVDAAFERVVAGAEKSRVLSDDEKRTTAYHEAGHAVVGYMLPGADKVTKISIVSRGRALGYTLTLPEDDRFLQTREELVNRMAMMLGGYVAEEMVNDGNTSTGPSNDLDRATAMAYAMVTRYAMSSQLGYRSFGGGADGEPNYAAEKARMIDEEVDALLDRAHSLARSVLDQNHERFDALAMALIDHEVVEGDEIEELMAS